MQSRQRRATVANRCGAALVRMTSRRPHRRLPSRVLHRLGRTLFLSTVNVDDGFAYTAYGVWLRQRADDRTFDFYLRGAYGFFLSDYLASQSQPFTFLDIGANAGLYSVLALRNPRVLGVHAFEPDPATLPYLRANLANAAPSKWTVHPVALSDRAGRAGLSTSSHHSGIATLRGSGLEGEPFDDLVTVELQDHAYLNASIRESSGAGTIVVKIDVEGHEFNAVRALAAWQRWPSVSAIYVEMDSTYSDTGPTIAFLEARGFVERYREGTAVHYDALYARPRLPAGTQSDLPS